MSDVFQQAAKFTSQFEGFSATIYKDIAGKNTIGYGTLLQYHRDVTEPISEDDALELLAKDLQKAYDCVTDNVKIGLDDKQIIALMDFIYNLGCGAFRGSTLLKLLNEGSIDITVANEFTRWDKAGGRVSAGLFKRRTAEATLFLTGVS